MSAAATEASTSHSASNNGKGNLEAPTNRRSPNASSPSSAVTTIQAPHLKPPPFYALVSTGLHRCSAIGLEEVLNEAWAEEAALTNEAGENGFDNDNDARSKPKSKRTFTRNHSNGSNRSGSHASYDNHDAGPSSSKHRSEASSKSTDRSTSRRAAQLRGTDLSDPTNARLLSTAVSESPTISISPSPFDLTPTPSSPHQPDFTTAAQSNLEHSSVLSFLSSLQLRTIVYLSPSLLPSALLKLSKQMNLNLVQWDLNGPKVWRWRHGAGEAEHAALRFFSKGGQAPASGHDDDDNRLYSENGDDDDHDDGHDDHDDHAAAAAEAQSYRSILDHDENLNGLDLEKMCRATVQLLLNRHCNGVLLCDQSGRSETSLVVGCLRRMMRWNFALVSLEYRAFAPVRSASTMSHLKFIELFPLQTLTLPDWPDLTPSAVRGLRDVQEEMGL